MAEVHVPETPLSPQLPAISPCRKQEDREGIVEGAFNTRNFLKVLLATCGSVATGFVFPGCNRRDSSETLTAAPKPSVELLDAPVKGIMNRIPTQDETVLRFKISNDVGGGPLTLTELNFGANYIDHPNPAGSNPNESNGNLDTIGPQTVFMNGKPVSAPHRSAWAMNIPLVSPIVVQPGSSVELELHIDLSRMGKFQFDNLPPPDNRARAWHIISFGLYMLNQQRSGIQWGIRQVSPTMAFSY